MKIDYVINLIIIGVKFIVNKDIKPNIVYDYFNSSGVCANCLVYRGSCVLRYPDYTIRVTKNGYVSIHIKNKFGHVLLNLRGIIFNLRMVFDAIFSLKKSKLTTLVKNIQITFYVKNEENFNFLVFCKNFVEIFFYKYHFEIKESNNEEFEWLHVVTPSIFNNAIYFNCFRIKYNKTIFTLTYLYQGTCLTRSIKNFFMICNDLKTSCDKL